MILCKISTSVFIAFADIFYVCHSTIAFMSYESLPNLFVCGKSFRYKSGRLTFKPVSMIYNRILHVIYLVIHITYLPMWIGCSLKVSTALSDTPGNPCFHEPYCSEHGILLPRWRQPYLLDSWISTAIANPNLYLFDAHHF